MSVLTDLAEKLEIDTARALLQLAAERLRDCRPLLASRISKLEDDLAAEQNNPRRALWAPGDPRV